MIRPYRLFAVLLGTLTVCGCGQQEIPGRPKLYPVSGSVIYDGQPAVGAVVMFSPQDHQFAATARTQTDGSFKLRTFEDGDGAAEGNYKVVVYKVDVEVLENGGVRETHHFPAKYKSSDSTPLTAVVSPSQKNDIRLTVAK